MGLGFRLTGPGTILPQGLLGMTLIDKLEVIRRFLFLLFF